MSSGLEHAILGPKALLVGSAPTCRHCQAAHPCFCTLYSAFSSTPPFLLQQQEVTHRVSPRKVSIAVIVEVLTFTPASKFGALHHRCTRLR